MRKVMIYLDSIDTVKSFVNSVNSFNSDFDIISAHHEIDAKSIMGVLSLDLQHPLQLIIHNDDPEILKGLKPYIVEKID